MVVLLLLGVRVLLTFGGITQPKHTKTEASQTEISQPKAFWAGGGGGYRVIVKTSGTFWNACDVAV